MRRAMRVAAVAVAVLGAAEAFGHGHGHGHDSAKAGGGRDLEAVAAVHGGAGPWAVAGYRMGRRALSDLKLQKFSFALKVTHRGPAEVQYACIADGAMAATGASPGKLNMTLETAPKEALATEFEDTRAGRRLVFKLRPEFVKAYLDVPRAKLAEAGQAVLALRDDEIFQVAAPGHP